jgi:acid stress-induced BolA-like protein IbaG/YrbA
MDSKEIVNIIKHILAANSQQAIDKLLFQTLRLTLNNTQLHDVYIKTITSKLS